MEEYLLSRYGLTRNEAKVYLALLKAGSSLAGEITKKTGIHRRSVYDAIERLQEKGLVSSVIIDNRMVFNPANPKRFIDIIDEEKHGLEEKRSAFEKILPKLTAIKSFAPKHDVRFFKGAEGIKTVYEDILRTGMDYEGYGHGAGVERILRFYLRHFAEKRINLGIRGKLIYSDKERNRQYVKMPMIQARFLPDYYSSHAALRIYGDKVALLLLSEDEPLAILIKNKNIADGYRKYFSVVWGVAKK